MGCHLAENEPLNRLRADLGLPLQCHSFRRHCLQQHSRPTDEFALGAVGAAIGYCQALFGRAGVGEAHTMRVLRLLQEIDAPWANSHELFWGYRREEPAAEFLVGGMRPLVGKGRIPVLITSLDPATDAPEIETIVNTQSPISPGETVLVRLVLREHRSIDSAVALLRQLVGEAKQCRRMPAWWPLFQARSDQGSMQRFAQLAGTLWPYANIAVNPFTPRSVSEVVREQVTVGQVVVGNESGIKDDGLIMLPAELTISGAPPSGAYSLPTYFEELGQFDTPPTLIILGPSLPSWSDSMNQGRIAKLVPHLHTACNGLWKRVEPSRREAVWRMSA